ncbi:hypothetical protein G4923_18345 [Aeromonas rivipollensis]|uniref:HNH nuclease domain-containing protein n=1 Tax=Aeromonas rivipollensis TaxID=948519 RepID=A0ABX0D6M4_9GAMM|nr:hypothetical protein [Aeromonas rivipollensis]NEX90626.1 hypothetical protein [Aeromonas rivipollensis]NEY07719.1 hypothetical protein [Aeromonas rivipollensis]
MLFSLAQQTPLCKVFKVLNDELLFFLKKSITAESFDDNLFGTFPHDGEEKRSACWSNAPTREKFETLWNNLPEGQFERAALYRKVSNAQNIHHFFDNTSTILPTLVNEQLFDAFKSLTTHLFTKTKDIAATKQQAGESIEQHFQSFFRANNNSMLCSLCGTSQLSQNRNDISDDEQWRADYDHILCKDKYPIYSVHPGNFIPTCHICNSKAKGARDLLHNRSSQRRIAFYPLPPSQDHCYQYTRMQLQFSHQDEVSPDEFEEPLLSVSVIFENEPVDIAQKVEVWKDVYQVPSRVEAHIKSNFFVRIPADLRYRENDFDDFIQQLRRYSGGLPIDYQKSEWRIWWHRVYEYLSHQDREYLMWIWSLLNWKERQISQVDMRAEFGY